MKQQSKESNPEGEEVANLTKREMRAEVQKMKPYPKAQGEALSRMDGTKALPLGFNRLDLPSFDGKRAAR